MSPVGAGHMVCILCYMSFTINSSAESARYSSSGGCSERVRGKTKRLSGSKDLCRPGAPFAQMKL